METTLTLRSRLGFNEVGLWKQFCARRLHLIHTLSLNLRKASEQEEQVRALAAELCAEYGFAPTAQGDFEKLLIAGIQSVRRNQKRSTRHMYGSSSYHFSSITSAPQGLGVSHLSVPNGQVSSVPTVTGPAGTAAPGGSQPMNAARPPGFSSPMSPLGMHSSSVSDVQMQQQRSSATSDHHSYEPYAWQEAPLSQSLAARLEVIRDLIIADATRRIELNSPSVAYMSAQGVLSTAVASAAIHAKLSAERTALLHQSVLDGTVLDALNRALDPRLTRHRLLERLGALAASLVHGPALLSAMQALFVSLAQSSQGSIDRIVMVLKPMTPIHLGMVSQPAMGPPLPAQAPQGPLLSAQPMQQAPQPTVGPQPIHIVPQIQVNPASQQQVPIIVEQDHASGPSLPQLALQSASPAHGAEMPPPPTITQAHTPPTSRTNSADHGYVPVLAQQPQPPTPQIVPGLQTPGGAMSIEVSGKKIETAPPQMPSLTTSAPPSGLPSFAQSAASSDGSVMIQQPPTQPHAQQQAQFPPQSVSPSQDAPRQQQHQQGLRRSSSHDGSDASESGASTPASSTQSRSSSASSLNVKPLASPSLSAPSSGLPPVQSVSESDHTASQNGGLRTGPDRLVSIEFHGRVLELTYSPLKATPPTLGEIIDNARKSFSVSHSAVVRVKDQRRNKIIETNDELIDAFSQPEVRLELMLPPPMLLEMPAPSSTRFTTLAPTLRGGPSASTI